MPLRQIASPELEEPLYAKVLYSVLVALPKVHM